ncbi:MAG: hypothetical protein QGG36_04005, partial [Pirellulaceae bacterium]|nr:hypothetical protein [Pirellulaceae bacterium]
LWAFGGWYQFQGGGQRVDGGMAGVRGYLTDSLAMSVNVSDDPMFGTNVGFTATYFFGGGSGGSVSPTYNVGTRMAEPLVRRDMAPQGTSTAVVSTQTLTNGGMPITVAHVNDAGPGGSGLLNDPFGTLGDAAGSPADVVFVHADSVFNGEAFMVGANQRFVGETIPFSIATDQLGAVVLPAATGGTNAPVILNAPGDAITLGLNSVVSGFSVVTPAGSGVVGVDAGNVLIQDVAVTGAAGAGLQLQVTGVNVMNATVLNNMFVGNGAQSGFLFGANAGAVLSANIFGNEDSLGYQLHRDANGFLRIGGTVGLGGFFNDDNGNLNNNGNTTGGGAPVINILGAGNQIEIIDPATIPAP